MKPNKKQLQYIFLAVGLCLSLTSRPLWGYAFQWLNVALVAAFLPFAISFSSNQERSNRYGWWALGLLTAYVFGFQLATVLFVAVCFFLLFILESKLGKLSPLPLVLLLLVSPFTAYLLKIFSFDLRLQLTQIAGFFLGFVEKDIRVEGNLIYLGKTLFAVDEACSGLNMLITAYIVGTGLLAFQLREAKKSISWLPMGGYLVVIGVLVLISNLCRIVSIVFLRAMPETLSHELLGIFSLVLWVFIPLYFISGFWATLFGGKEFFSFKLRFPPLFSAYAKNMLMGSFFVGLIYLNFQPAVLEENPQADFSGYEKVAKKASLNCSMAAGGTLKMTSPQAIIYAKPCLGFYRSEHNPTICWRGSGYALSQEQKKEVGGKEIFIAELQKNEDVLYTAWWYESDGLQTTSQWEWRKQMLQHGDKIFLINITCESPEQVQKEVLKWFGNGVI
ncbi:exosortase N [Flammeovirgaceae bacterium SG7u.111]|nr:exosortase N [Flammeovirgaceae bacterium SG7u.132]WPO36031.1 exosortase N [Flammeovirgaceae bacterium SG7u.111]